MTGDSVCSDCGGALPVGYRATNGHPALCSDACRRKARRLAYKKWYHSHQQQALESRQSNKAKDPDYFKRHYLKNSERIKKRSIDWYLANKTPAQEQFKRYAAANPDVIKRCSFKSAHKRRAIVKKVFVEHVDPHVVYDRDNGICGICKRRVDRNGKWEIDHVIPISKGGVHAYANVQLAHQSCNRTKSATIPVGQHTLFQVAVS